MDFLHGFLFLNIRINTEYPKHKMNSTFFSEYDKKMMRLAMKLAGKARGMTSPNPLVGAVIVKDGKTLSSGYHRMAGGPHAEIEAMDTSPDRTALKNALLYVTLEPCSFYGKTPPCTDAIIKYGFSEVIIGSMDPNPEVSGSGIQKLKNAGIKVRYGLLEEKIAQQNEFFFKHIVSGSPFVTLKVASSIDGKIAVKSGDSKWITGIQSRRLVHKIRKDYDCILTGINTVINDDPYLYPRGKNGINPDIDKCKKYYRVILDSNLRTSTDSIIARTSGKIKTMIFTWDQSNPDRKKVSALKSMDIDIIKVHGEQIRKIPGKSSKSQAAKKDQGSIRLDISSILKKLYDDYGITSIIIESGPTLATEFLRKGLIDKFLFFISPSIIGGDSDYSMFSELDIRDVDSSISLDIKSKKTIGTDILITAYPEII
jgi:diaminohydroxyphosphoribosylaminopyrimidine deaminase/5-amino-6-(5-phosphoribosylamino)uracil reductase